MMSYSSVGERLIVDPEDWDYAEMEGIGEVGSVLATTTTVDLLRRELVSIMWPGRLQ